MASRDYNNDYPSVTQVLGVLRKIGLEMWFKYGTAKECDKESELGKLIGKQIHEVIHDYIQNGTAKIETTYGEEVLNALKGFIQFKKDYPNIKLINSEMELTSEIFKFNGTTDCLAEENSVELIADWKSGKAKKKDKPDIYPEYKYQVAAYVKLYNEVHKKDIKRALILSLAKDKIAYNVCFMDEAEINDHFNNAFLPALSIYNHQKTYK